MAVTVSHARRALVAALLLPALAGCKALLNEDFDGDPAPALDGGVWVGGKAPRQEWRILTFFAPDEPRCIAKVPRLMAMQAEFGPKGVAVVAVTRADVAAAERFAAAHGATYAILAGAAMAFERWGIGSPAYAPVYVIDPGGRVLAEGFDDCTELLRERLGA